MYRDAVKIARDAERDAWRKEKEAEEAARDPWEEEKYLCEQLIAYVEKHLPKKEAVVEAKKEVRGMHNKLTQKSIICIYREIRERERHLPKKEAVGRGQYERASTMPNSIALQHFCKHLSLA